MQYSALATSVARAVIQTLHIIRYESPIAGEYLILTFHNYDVYKVTLKMIYKLSGREY